MHSPRNVLDEATLFKHAQHALLCPRPYPARLLLPCRISCSRIRVLSSPFFLRPLATRQRVLSPYTVLTDILPWS